ncbi:MAG: hypothetical protein QM778_33295 [Myxococcales bacterium]
MTAEETLYKEFLARRCARTAGVEVSLDELRTAYYRYLYEIGFEPAPNEAPLNLEYRIAHLVGVSRAKRGWVEFWVGITLNATLQRELRRKRKREREAQNSPPSVRKVKAPSERDFLRGPWR